MVHCPLRGSNSSLLIIEFNPDVVYLIVASTGYSLNYVQLYKKHFSLKTSLMMYSAMV